MPLFFCLLLLLLPGLPPQAGNPKKAVAQTIVKLFDGMRAGDSAAVRSVFLPEATMGTILKNREGQTVARRELSPDGFIKAVGTPHEEVWDERIGRIDVRIDGDMAVAWTPYSFYRGTTFSHCGVNTFTLVKLGDSWRIMSIIDTRRKDSCPK